MLEKDIVSMGLSQKEAKVYLASLELGPSPVQIISQKAKVNRATTYVVIDSLMDMGLMATFDEGKKTFFAAENPERLMEYLKNNEKGIQDKIRALQERMPELKSMMNSEDKPKIRYYEGLEGLRTVQSDLTETLRAGEVVYTFLPFDDYFKTGLKEKVADITSKRIRKKIQSKVIYTSRFGRQIDYEKAEERKLKEYLYIDYGKYPFSGGMNIYADKIFMIDYKGRTGGIVIENKTLANMMRKLFLFSWEMGKKQQE